MTETKDVVRAIIEKAVEAAAKKGATLDFEIGVPNNLFKKDGDEP